MNHWDKKFDSDSYIYGKEANAFVKEIFKNKTNCQEKVLLLAEGEGRNAIYLALLGYDVTTYDFSKVGIQKQLKLAEEAQVHIDANYGDITEPNLVPSRTYDYTINIFGHVLPEDKERMFDNLIHPLVKNGHSYFELYSLEQLEYGTGGPSNIDMLYEIEEIRHYLATHSVKIHKLEKNIVERHEGIGHSGQASVIQGHIEKI